MDRWVLYAILSMAFAGLTAAIAKLGLAGISAELGIAVRTFFVFLFVIAFAGFVVERTQLQTLKWNHVAWLALSAVTTAISWIFYFKAIHEGQVSTVVIIDKGSFIVAVLLSWMVLGETITWRTALGCGLILAGLLVVIRR